MATSLGNQAIARLLRAVAAAYQVQEDDRFRVAAYERAADSAEHSTSELKDLWDDGKLGEIAGIGASIASHLDEFFRTGKVKHFDQVMRGLPPAMFELLLIPGIGAKTAYKLCRELGIESSKTAVRELEKAAKSGKISQIESFGQKSESDILEAIKAFQAGQTKEKRMLLPYADAVARDVLSYLEKCPFVKRVDALGSLRRMVSTIGDIDIAAQTTNPAGVIDWFVKYPKIKRVLGKGEEALVRVVLDNGCQVDLRLQTPSSYGSMLQYFTGGKNHNISLREWALKRGMSLSEHGIKIKGKLKRCESEETFYKILGMDWIPPEIREDTGEIETAHSHKLPSLIKLEEIKGDLHIHSDFQIETSHDLGVSSMEEVVDKAAGLEYEYLGFCEHNPSSSGHNNDEIVAILKRKKEVVDKINYSSEKRVSSVLIHVFNGLEIDIKPTGALAIPEEGLAYLDYAMVSVHSSFKMPRDMMTKRVLKALDHPKVKIFGHPTGRKLNAREGYELDWEKIFDFCLTKQKWLEINAWPDRLDLPDSLVREAVKRGVKMIICTDSHAADQLELMSYGVAVARRGWAEKRGVVNTLNYEEFKLLLEK